MISRRILTNSVLLAAGPLLHEEIYSLQTGCLSDLIMQASNVFHTSFSHIDDEVSKLAKEVALVDVPLRTISTGNVFISRNDTKSVDKRGCGLDSRSILWISDKLSVVISLDGSTDSVGSSREVDESRPSCH